MNKSISTFIVVALVSWSSLLLAQYDSSVDEAFEETSFANDLWYGGGFVLGFSGGNNSSLFQFGLTPMVGYKITKNFSIGPRVGFTYQYLKSDAQDINSFERSIRHVNLTEYVAGFFGRYKILNQFFIHAEGEFRSTELPLGINGFLAYDPAKGKVLTARESNFNPILGAGYSSSGGSLWAYEIMLLYRFNIPENDRRTPFDIRFGFTYNF